MYNTPAANRLHIGIFGRRNVGKSSLINAVTGQKLAIVSDVAGTTTDPVYKSMEILPIGPCMLIDTAGIDDAGALGEERVKKTMDVLRKTDVGILVVEPTSDIGVFEDKIIALFVEKKIPYIFVVNKCDNGGEMEIVRKIKSRGAEFIKVSSKTNEGIEDLKLKIISIAPPNWSPVPLVSDIVGEGDTVVLVCPIDSAMPQGRLILPQVQVLRDILDAGATAFVTKDTELAGVLDSLKEPPDLVITDSQVFETVQTIVPVVVPLTSFSMIYARHKGDIMAFVEGVQAVKNLKNGDEILISEACTHHVQPEDIGRSKIPTWLMDFTGKDLNYEVTAGGDFPADLKRFKLVICCGGCMVNRREMLFRVEKAKKEGVAITNYGILISYFSGILERTLEPFRKGIVKLDKRPLERAKIY